MCVDKKVLEQKALITIRCTQGNYGLQAGDLRSWFLSVGFCLLK